MARGDSVGVVGLGHVGTYLADDLRKRGLSVATYDRATSDDYPMADFRRSRYIFICVDTPQAPDGSADLANVVGAIAQIPAGPELILRSTVTPGTTASLMQRTGRVILHWPEYVGESSFAPNNWADLRAGASFAIIGGERTASLRFADFLSETYGPFVRLHRVSSDESELTKYMENCFLALKVSFVNDFRRLCEQMNADWHQVREGWLLDTRVGRDHSAAFVSARGFTGRCLPKDVNALMSFAKSLSITMPTVDACVLSNRLGILTEDDEDSRTD